MDKKELHALDDVAESVRQAHCDRKHQKHKCVGVMTVSKDGVKLDCKVCGEDWRYPDDVPGRYVIREARELCSIVGVVFDELPPQSKKSFLLRSWTCPNMVYAPSRIVEW